MFRKKPASMFEFKGQMTKAKTVLLDENYQYNAHVILCGTHSEELIKQLGWKESKETELLFHSFEYTARNAAKGRLDITVDSYINYLHQKNKKDTQRLFTHSENTNFKQRLDCVPTTSVKTCDPDFQSEHDLWIIIAAKTTEETAQWIKQLNNLLKGKVVSHFIYLNHSEQDITTQVSFITHHVVKASPDTIACVHEMKCRAPMYSQDWLEYFAKLIHGQFKTAAESMSTDQAKNIVEQTQTEIVNEFESSLDQQAQDKFSSDEERWRSERSCRIS